MTSYASILTERGQAFAAHDPWLLVRKPRTSQGWKLHVSATPFNGDEVLRAVIPIFDEYGVAWKCLASPGHVARLNEGGLGPTQMGKFICVYLEGSEDEAVAIAVALDIATQPFEGPRVVTDMRIGSNLYARYGCFLPTHDRLGNKQRLIQIDGERVEDTYQVPYAPPVDIPCPFTLMAEPYLESKRNPLSEQFVLTDILSGSGKGAVFRAIAMREGEVQPVIVKQGRALCCLDEYGRDVWDRLAHQAGIMRDVTDRIPEESVLRLPTPLDFIRNEDEHFLIMEYIRDDAHRSASTNSLSDARLLASALRDLHALGILHRDITPGNVVFGRDVVFLLDWELAYYSDGWLPPYALGTPGFMSPNQAASGTPVEADDRYAFGAFMFHRLVGRTIDEFRDCHDLAACLSQLSAGVDPRLVRAIGGCVEAPGFEVPEDMASVVDMLEAPKTADTAPGTWTRTEDTVKAIQASREAMEAGILECAADPDGCWLSAPMDGTGVLESRGDLHHGFAGALLAALRWMAPDDEAAMARVRVCGTRLAARADLERAPRIGLYFGASGQALALAVAAASIPQLQNEATAQAVRHLLSGRLDWHDLTHGAAGHGIALLQCHAIHPEWGLETRLDECAAYLLDAEHDGDWLAPEGVPGISNTVLYGLGHGNAGIALFLLRYGIAQGEPEAVSAARRAMDRLIDSHLEQGGGWAWPWGPENPQVWNWWCHGAVGISLLFSAAFGHLQEERYADAAHACLSSFPEVSSVGSLGLCHGLSGFGHAVLSARARDPRPQYDDMAEQAARTIWANRCVYDGAIFWRTNGPRVPPTADLMTGTSGVVDFLLHFADGSAGFPGLDSPLGGTGRHASAGHGAVGERRSPAWAGTLEVFLPPGAPRFDALSGRQTA